MFFILTINASLVRVVRGKQANIRHLVFHPQRKTSIALVCDETEEGKVDPMVTDSSTYVSVSSVR